MYFGVYPGHAEFGVDIRTLPGMKRENVIREIQDFLNQRQLADPTLEVQLEIEEAPLDWIEPTEVSENLPLVRALADASREVLGFCPLPESILRPPMPQSSKLEPGSLRSRHSARA